MGTTELVPNETKTRYLARQPILALDKKVFAYEILSRFGPENYCRPEAQAAEHAVTMDELFLMGLKRMTNGLPAFLNCPREFLLGDYLALLPRESVVGEILETVEPDEQVLTACRRIKEQGYKLALDDYQDRSELQPLVELADFIKADFQSTAEEELARLAGKFRNWGIPLIAEKVETKEQFEAAKSMGFEYFQGYFFCRPEMVTRKKVPANSARYYRLLQATYHPDIDLVEIADLMKPEASLSYRLLRYLNSPAFPLRSEIHSIPHALALLGERAVKKWISLVCVAGIGEGKPAELVKMPLMRARFCELLGQATGMLVEANDLFLLGLLSMMDVLLEKPMTEVLEELPVDEEIKQALRGEPGRFQRILEIALNFETGRWEKISEGLVLLGVKESLVSELHLKAVEWADEVLSEAPVPAQR